MKTFKILFTAAALFSISLVFCGDVIALWDFQQANPLKGKYPLSLRGKSIIGKGGLWIPAGEKNERAGAAATKKELQPLLDGAFTVTVEFSISSKQKHTQSNLVLLDNKYVPNGKKPEHNCGFMLFLRRSSKADTFVPCAAFGFGTESAVVSGTPRLIKSDERHVIKMTFDARGGVKFVLDNKTAGNCKVPVKKLAPAVLPLHIGDRAGASYWPLGGTIKLVKIEKYKAPEAPAPPAPGNVIAKWDFTNKSALKGKYSIKLRGKAALGKDGLSVLNSNIKQPDGAIISGNFPELSPANAFDLTAKVTLDGNYQRTRNWAMIFDAKYVTMPRNEKQKRYHKGFAFFLMPQGNDSYRLGAAFGYGDKSAQVVSSKVTLESGVEYALAMRFTATGKVIFSVNGKVLSTANVPAGNIAPTEVNISIGDRSGANYFPLGGTIRSIEIKSAKYTPQNFSADITSRQVFERGEKKSLVKVDFFNFVGSSLKNVTIKCVNAGVETAPAILSEVAPKSKTPLEFAVDTTLLPGKYFLELTALDNAKKKIAFERIEYTIVPSYGDFMPVMLWGNHEDIKLIRKAGFTHQLVHLFPRQGNFDPETLKRWIPHLDENLKHGLYTFGTLHSHFRFISAKRYLRTGKDGAVYPRANLEASNPEACREFAQAAETTVKAVGNHPAFDGVLINSEVRDGSLPSFGSGIEPAAFKKFAGYDIPETITGKSPKPYTGDPAFPWDRVIPDNHKDLVFLRWFWDIGDGWNPLQTLLSKTMHDALPPERSKRFFTFYDPATRVPPMWGSGGNVDMISQWTYAYPDPIKIGQATDEVIAMAQGNPRQKIASMTQAIWYRSQTAPVNVKVKNAPDWLNSEREAMFISLSPDSLREAFWSKISRRLDAIMYHGVGSLLTKTDHKLYRMTNYRSREVLAELCKDVVRPLGPVLKRVPERPAEVAILHSLASGFYAPKHFPMGWSKGWAADLHLALQWGHFQPAIIFDEHLLNDRGTKELKVLFTPGLEVVNESVLAKLNQLRRRGVVIVGDEFTTPALLVDHRIKSIQRNAADPVQTKNDLQKLGRELAAVLEKYAPRRAVASNQDLVLRQRGCDQADYLFVVNDRRTFGNYIGQWKLVQENGLPNSGTITVRHSAAAAYDLAAHRELNLKTGKNNCSLDLSLAPGDGKVILLLDKKIEKLSLKVPTSVRAKEPFSIECAVLDGAENPVKAYIPIALELKAADGTALPGSGYYAAVNGKYTLKEVMASNVPAGKITVTLRCLASGKTASATLNAEK